VPEGAVSIPATVDSVAVSGRNGGGMPEGHFLLNIATTATYSWWGDITSVELCRGTCAAQECWVLTERAGFTIALEPGYYVLRVSRSADAAAGASLALDQPPD